MLCIMAAETVQLGAATFSIINLLQFISKNALWLIITLNIFVWDLKLLLLILAMLPHCKN